MSIITSADVKLFLDIPSATSSEDDIIAVITSAAEQYVIEYTGCSFTSALTSAYYDGTGFGWIYLKTPILGVTSIKYAGNKNDISTATALTATTQYIYYPTNGKVQLTSASHFPIGYQNIYVEYTHGYVTVPQTIKNAAIEIAVDLFQSHRKGRFGVMEKELDSRTGLRQRFITAFLKPSTKAMLDLFKNPMDEQNPLEL